MIQKDVNREQAFNLNLYSTVILGQKYFQMCCNLPVEWVDLCTKKGQFSPDIIQIFKSLNVLSACI